MLRLETYSTLVSFSRPDVYIPNDEKNVQMKENTKLIDRTIWCNALLRFSDQSKGSSNQAHKHFNPFTYYCTYFLPFVFYVFYL